MAHYVRVPKDLNDLKEKFMFNLTKRQVICFGIGFLMGLPVFFIVRERSNISNAITFMGIVAAPAIICGLYKKNGVYFEQRIKHMIEFFKRPKTRYYRSTNIFRCIENHMEYDKLKRVLKKAEGGRKNGAVFKSIQKEKQASRK